MRVKREGIAEEDHGEGVEEDHGEGRVRIGEVERGPVNEEKGEKGREEG